MVHRLLGSGYPFALMGKGLPEGFGIRHEVGRDGSAHLFYLKHRIICPFLLQTALNQNIITVESD
ncbi:hypothetical protein D3C76_1839270 [compost metagenome]